MDPSLDASLSSSSSNSGISSILTDLKKLEVSTDIDTSLPPSPSPSPSASSISYLAINDLASTSTPTKEKVITIAISGPSSSGKSTLAFLLNEIFNRPPQFTPITSIINEDAFFLPKSQVPHVSFLSAGTPSEIEYLKRSVKEDKFGQYGYEKLDEQERWRISGPNTDRPEAIDFQRLLAAVQAAKFPSSSTTVGVENLQVVGAQIPGIETSASELRERYMGMNARMRMIVDCFFSKDEAWSRTHFVFVEGFLLFTPPLSTENENEVQKTELQQAREELMGLFDVCLFLPAEKEDARKRRFERKAYVDTEKGDLREPGQMWRSEGYFEDIV